MRLLRLPPFARGLLGITLLAAGCTHLPRPIPKKTVIPPDFSASAVAEPPPLDPELLQRPTFEYRLGPGDVLDIEVLGDVNTLSRSIVGPDGKIYFYLLPGLDVWGLTLAQTRERIVQELQKLVREQQPVSITLRKSENQRIWILGQLRKPGIYSMPGPMTLLEALAEAGGPASGMGASRLSSEEDAGLDRAFILRQGRTLRIDFTRLLRDGDLSQNVYLQPDDFIFLPPTTKNVHVLGAVGAPNAISFVDQLTLAQAVAQAGGTRRRQAQLTQVAIVRGSLTQPKIAIVDLTAILAGRAPDVALAPQDIVFLPEAPFSAQPGYVDLILDTFVRTVGVNEGSRAVDGSAQPLGTGVPVGGPTGYHTTK